MKTIKVRDDAFEFLAWLMRQDVTLPSVMMEYLKWDRYTIKEIKAYLHALNDACTKARLQESSRSNQLFLVI